MLAGCQSQDCADRPGVAEARRHIDGDAESQRHHRPNTWDGHQPPAHVIVTGEGQHAAVEDGDLLAQHPPDNEQWFNERNQVREILDQLPDACLELNRPDHAHLETEVTQGRTQVVLDGNGLRLQQLAMGQQRAQLLAA